MLDYTLITSQLESMQKDLHNSEVMTKESYRSKYDYLATYVPTLFELLYKNNDVDIEQLKFMITQAKKIDNKEVTQYDADVVVGQKLADTYITPIVEAPTKKETFVEEVQETPEN
jgi:hypothetical protein